MTNKKKFSSWSDVSSCLFSTSSPLSRKKKRLQSKYRLGFILSISQVQK